MFSPCARAYQRWISSVFALSLLAGVSLRSHAGDHCCTQCGVANPCYQVCRAIPDQKKVPIVCWGLKSEDFCVPGPSCKVCQQCELACEPGDDPQAPCTHTKNFVWNIWSPSERSRIYTRHKLMKKTVTKTVPSWKWVIEDLCEQCALQAQASAAETPGPQLPLLARSRQ